MAFGEIGGVGGNFVGNQALLNVFFIRQAEVLFWRHVAEHRAAEPADHGGANSRGEMVVARRDISG